MSMQLQDTHIKTALNNFFYIKKIYPFKEITWQISFWWLESNKGSGP